MKKVFVSHTNIKKRKKILCFFLSTLSVISLLSPAFTVIADESAGSDDGRIAAYSSDAEAAASLCGMEKYGHITVLKETSASSFRNAVTTFDSTGAASGWISSEGCGGITVTDATDRYPWKTLFGKNCMSVTASEGSADSWHCVERLFISAEGEESTVIQNGMPAQINPGKIDVESCKNLSFAVNLPDAESGDGYELRLRLEVSGWIVFNETFEIHSSGWNTVFADLSEVHKQLILPAEYTKISIAVRPIGTGDDIVPSFNMYLDGLSFSAHDAAQKYRFLTSDFFAYGGTLTYSDDSDTYSFDITTDADAPFIETVTLDETALDGASAVRLSFRDLTGCTAVSCYYKTSSQSEYSEGMSSTVLVENSRLPQSDIISCTFPLRNADEITSFRIVFKGCTENAPITLLSLSAATAVGIDTVRYGSIDSCRLSHDSGEITIKGKVGTEISDKYLSSRLYVYALDPWQTCSDETLSELSPVAQTDMSSEFSVKFKTENYALKKFTAAIRTGTGFLIIDTDKWVTNIRSTASDKTQPSEKNLKGIITETTEAQYIGSEATYIEVDMATLPSLTPTEYSFEYGGETYYYSTDALDALDAQVQNRAHSGEKIYLRLLLSMPEDVLLADALVYEKSSSHGTVNAKRLYAPNVSNEDGVMLFSALCNMLASRYGGTDKSCVDGFIIGRDINDAYNNFYAGDMKFSDFAAYCASIVRIVYNSTAAVAPNIRIYISFGSDWFNARGIDATSIFDTRELISAIAEKISHDGNVDWLPAFSIARPSYNSENSTADLYETKTLTSDKVDMLCSFMRGNDLLYGELPRNIMILSDVDAETEDDMTLISEYIYDFYNISESASSLVDVFITSPSFDIHAHERTLRYLDTDASLGETAEYAGYFMDGAESWIEIFGNDRIQELSFSRTVIEAETLAEKPEHIGSAKLWNIDGSKNTDGWACAESCVSIETADLPGHDDTLIAKLKSTDSPAAWRGVKNDFTYVRDFSVFSYLSMDVELSQMPETVKNAELLVLIYSGRDYIVARRTVSSDGWNNVVISLSAFNGAQSIDRIKIMVRGENGETDIGSPTLLVSDLTALSTEHDDRYLSNHINNEKNKYIYNELTRNTDLLVPVLTGIIVAAVLLEVVNVTVRARRKERKTKEAPPFRR